MENTLFQWLFNLIKEFAKFGNWLTEPLPYLNLPPLAVFGFVGFTALIGFLLLRLVVGG